MSALPIEVPEHIQLLNPYEVNGPGVEYIRPIFSVIGVNECHGECLCEQIHRKSRRWQRGTPESLVPPAPPWTTRGGAR